MRGVVPVAYAVFAVVLGVTVGAVLRRPIAAMALTLALYVVVQVVVPLWVRPHLVAPTTASVMLRHRHPGLAERRRVGADGSDHRPHLRPRRLAVGEPDPRRLRRTGGPADLADGLRGLATDRVEGAVQAQPVDPCLQRLTAEGYTQRVVYQPASNFWPIQWAETVLSLAASGLLAGWCVWWTRRRLS